MKKSSRYDSSGLVEAQFEPGSHGRVLKNLLGIKRKREMDVIEQQEQDRVLKELFRIYDMDHRFTEDDVRKIHKLWLGPIYSWAGKYRQVNLTKGDFPFAFAKQVPKLMENFGKGQLCDFTPCRFELMGETIRAISVVHTELVLIHPFREGNGRVARLLAILMASQMGWPPLDFFQDSGAYETKILRSRTRRIR